MVSVRKRGKVYEYRFEIATVEGTRKWITKSGYPTKAEAFKEGAKAYNDFYYNGQKTQLRENMSYADFLDYWIDNYASFNLHYSTTISYINIIKNHVKPRVGFYKLWQLDTRLLQEFINKIYVEYGFSKNYMASILKVVKGSLKYACYTLNYINTNPAEHVHAPRIDKIGKYYGNKSSLTKAIDNLSFDVEKGEFVAIMGASGSGKTTLLNCISTIDKVTSGHIYVAGNDITKLRGNSLNKFRREELGFIFQDFNLLDTLTAYENIALALSIQNVNSREIDTRIKKVAKELDIVDVLNKYPYQMSGGQKQRVASARAIITNPKLILADEPTGALDSKSAKMLLEKFDYLNKELQATILMVTHDAFTASYSSRVIFIKDGKIFNEIIKGTNSRKEFFDKIIDVVTLLGGDLNDAL